VGGLLYHPGNPVDLAIPALQGDRAFRDDRCIAEGQIEIEGVDAAGLAGLFGLGRLAGVRLAGIDPLEPLRVLGATGLGGPPPGACAIVILGLGTIILIALLGGEAPLATAGRGARPAGQGRTGCDLALGDRGEEQQLVLDRGGGIEAFAQAPGGGHSAAPGLFGKGNRRARQAGMDARGIAVGAGDAADHRAEGGVLMRLVPALAAQGEME